MKLKDFLETKKFKIALASLGAFIILLLVFQLGVFVGFNKARWSFQWGENYHKNFGGPQGGFLRDFAGDEFIGGHGTPGELVKVDNDGLIIKDPRGIEKIVVVSDKTTIKKGTGDLSLSDLKIGERLVVIGEPLDNGSIEAQLIRIFDPNDIPLPPPGKVQFKGIF